MCLATGSMRYLVLKAHLNGVCVCGGVNVVFINICVMFGCSLCELVLPII